MLHDYLRLQERRYIQSLVLLYNILSTPTPTYLSTRFHLLPSYHGLSILSQHVPILSMPSNRTSLHSSSFIGTASHSCNSLPSPSGTVKIYPSSNCAYLDTLSLIVIINRPFTKFLLNTLFCSYIHINKRIV